MSAPDTIPVAVPPRRRWALYGIMAAVTIAVALLAIIGVRSLTARPAVALGETSAPSLLPGACLAEDQAGLTEYTVVACSDGHAQQVIGPVELGDEADTYSTFEAVGTFAEAVCDRYLDYGLYLTDEASRSTHDVGIVAMPSEAEYGAGQTTALCSVNASDGSALTSDLYEPLP